MTLFLSRGVFSCIRSCDFELALAANVVRSGRAVSEISRSSLSRQVFELGRVIPLMTAQPLEYHNNL